MIDCLALVSSDQLQADEQTQVVNNNSSSSDWFRDASLMKS
jgi:hypothetical protein